MADKIEIPRRKVNKNWYVGLDSDPVDRSHPDVHDDLLVMEAAEKISRKLFIHSFEFFICSNFAQNFLFGPYYSSFTSAHFWKRVLESA